MLIKRLEVKGFKSLRDVVWEPGPLTVLIGPNGSGKSNLLHAIDLLSFSAMGDLDGAIHRLGKSASFFWDEKHDDAIFNATIDISDYTNETDSDYVKYKLALSNENGISYRIIYEELTAYSNSDILLLIKRSEETEQVFINGELYQNHNSVGYITKKESILSKFPSSIPTNNKIHQVNLALTSPYIYQQFDRSPTTSIRQPAVIRNEQYVDMDGQNLVNVLHTLYSESRDFESDINTAMRAAFGDDFDRLVFTPATENHIQLCIRWKSLNHDQSMRVLSDGTIQFLFLLTVLCDPEPPSMIVIDNPETGLHPAMFPIIAEYAAEASKRTQVIFSTHSPQFLDAFSDFDVTTTVTAWKDGETKIKNLDGDTLKKWLEHYSLGSLFLSGDLEALA